MSDLHMSAEYIAKQTAKRQDHLDFDVESWLPLLQDLTFPTMFIDLSPATAKSLVAFYRARYNGSSDFTDQVYRDICALTKTLDDALGLAPYAGHGAFVRMSSR